MTKSDQELADERLIAALKDHGVFQEQDAEGRIFYGDGETWRMEVAVDLTEDPDESIDHDGACVLGQYALEQLEAGDIEMLWAPPDEYDKRVWGPDC
ncbi:hypothetical protein KIH27_16135 [Mycobacterium sp. M1]|uniref:Uncharacterized protein n=1 Tax=Mycolicibacter acidiphilus TaxID=2835306 RepID=A0ABS5RLE7_9MYCO|nr:hypothetical protein [Mycolicibacter acidiphilus]MBS9535117.1 hypothetical protein [Mycolicibacter acidiphilus]